MNHKIGFWSLFAIVTGSQIGSGIFMLPANLAPFGWYAAIGWMISGIGAICLALVFSNLCAQMPKTGGPHVYVQERFGNTAGFFTAWTYWMVSWVSTTAVIVAAIGYLTPLLGNVSATTTLILQIALLFIVTLLNLRGIYATSRVEFILTTLKFIPLLVLPILGFMHFNVDNIQLSEAVSLLPTPNILSHVVLLTLWGFIGLEIGTTPAASVENPSKTIPKAVVWGTITVAVVYLFNSLSLMGVMPSRELAVSKAPFADAAHHMLDGQWYLIISLIASILCIGTLNAWALGSGQIALGGAQDRLLPSVFAKTNRYGAPYVALLISAFGIVPLLYLTTHTTLAEQLAMIIDFSVTAFLFVYIAATLSFLKKANRTGWLYGLIALAFCIVILTQTSLQTLCVASLFTLSGLPIWFFRRRHSSNP